MNRRSRQSTKKETRNFWSYSFFAVLAMFLGAMFQISDYIHQSSLLGDLQKSVSSISAENDTFEVKLSQSNSLANFSQYAAQQAGNYEKVDVAAVRYVHASSEQFAKK